MDRRIFMAYGDDAKDMTLSLMEAADIKERVPKNATIALKPNLVVARKPEGGATTHGDVLEGVIIYMQKHGFKDISIIEGSWVGDRTERAFQVCGYDEIGRKYGVPLYDLKKDSYIKVKTAIGDMPISKRAMDANYLINLPVLKGHCQTIMTCALKNCKGCISDPEKRRFHTMGLHKPIAALAAVLKPELTIVDSICGDLDFEEGGTPVQTNRMYLGEDMVQLDALGCRLMGIPVGDVSYIALAEKYGAGSADLRDEDIISINEAESANWQAKPTGVVARLTRGVTADQACSACYGNLVHALHRLEGRLPSKPGSIVIGQGFKGKNPDGFGIGSCCSGANDFVKGCPPSAEAIIEALRRFE
ncbi:MAG: DUF362 domain-containing protein [Christensenellales bacterium]|jgi:uncharacterized protein (DUF362 family)